MMEAVAMMKRSLLVLGLVGCMAAMASAVDVVLEHWLDGDVPDGVNQPMIVDNTGGDATVTVQIGLSAPTGRGFLAGADLRFKPPTGFTLNDFEWDRETFDPGWFFDDSLPWPAVATTGVVFPAILPGPNPQTLIGTLELTIAQSVDLFNGGLGVEMGTNPTMNDENFGENNITDGRSMLFTPEPATMALLVLGGLTALRRRS